MLLLATYLVERPPGAESPRGSLLQSSNPLETRSIDHRRFIIYRGRGEEKGFEGNYSLEGIWGTKKICSKKYYKMKDLGRIGEEGKFECGIRCGELYCIVKISIILISRYLKVREGCLQQVKESYMGASRMSKWRGISGVRRLLDKF